MVNLRKNVIPKEELFDLYIIQNLPVREIADKFNVNVAELYKLFKKYIIPLRNETNKIIINKDELYDLYINKELSTRDIANIFQVGQTTIRRYLDNYNIQTRNNLEGHRTKVSREKRVRINKETLGIRIPKLIKNVENKCEYCEKIFITKPSKKRPFCSEKCYINFAQKNNKKILCNQCNKEIILIQYRFNNATLHFCDKKCEGEYRSKNYVGKNNPSYRKIKINCGYCNKEILVIPSVYNKNEKCYCSYKCMGKDYQNRLKGDNNPHWNGSYRNDYYGIIWHKIRERIRRRDNYTCQKCGVTENELNYSFTVHHKRTTSKFKTLIKAHKYSNLITLCKKCHTFVHSNKNIYNLYIEE